MTWNSRQQQLKKGRRDEQLRTFAQDRAWLRGYVAALAELNRWHDQPSTVGELLRSVGVKKISTLKVAGVEEYDLRQMRKGLRAQRNEWEACARCTKRKAKAVSARLTDEELQEIETWFTDRKTTHPQSAMRSLCMLAELRELRAERDGLRSMLNEPHHCPGCSADGCLGTGVIAPCPS